MTLIEILESLKQGELGLYRAYIAENNINALAEEAKKRVENGELNNIAKGEVEEFKLDENQYRQALSLLKISNGTQGLFNQAVNAYKSASKSLEELVEERNIGQIAKRYDQFKDEVSTEELILLNVGELEDNYKDDGTIEQIKKSTTFAHQLFEAGISKENVMHYFAKVHDVLGYDKELAKNYMSLSDNPGGISIIELLKQHNNKVGYQGIYDELKEKYVRLFPIEGGVVEIQVDTHTGSIHSSVDKSLVRIGEELKDERITKVNERELKVERDSEWNKEIDGTITELKERLISLNEKEIPAYISDTLSKKDDIQEEVAKFKYQIETALRLIDGLEKGRYGSTYTVDAVTPTSCGFSVKEIVAIAYKELSNKENWENPESEKQHFITFIEGLYDAKKGYNIDRHLKGDIDQWQEHRTEGDNNRCTSGAVNSVVKHISDHKLVNIQIINANTMQGPIENHLGDILDKLYQDTEQNKELIGQWLYIGIIKEDLLAKIKNKLKEDREFTNEFNEEAIDRFAGPAIRSIKTQLLKQIAKSFKEFKQLNDNQLLMRDFVFNEEKGYVLYMEELYKKEDEVFKNIIENEIKRTMIVDEDSELSRKGRTFINLLLSSNNKEFRLEVKNKVKVVFSEELSQNSINNLLILSAKYGNKELFNTLLDVKADITAKDVRNNNMTPLHHAALSGQTNIVKIILEAKPEAALVKNYRGDTPLHHTALSGQTDIVKIILEAVPKAALVKDKYRSTPLHIAAERGRTDIVKELLEAVPEAALVKNYRGDTPLHNAALSGQTDIVEKLLAVNLEAALKQNKEGSTPLHNAALSGQTDIVKIIVEAKSEAALIRDNGDNTPLHTAVYKGYIDIVKIILEAVPEAALIKNYKEGYTLLHDVVLSDKTDIVK